MGSSKNQSLSLVVVALIGVLATCFMVPEIRWNLVLFVFLPLRHMEIAEGLLDSYLDLEIWWNPRNFEAPPVAEIQGVEYSWQKIADLSKGFREPIIIRGLMNDTVGMKEFGTKAWVDSHGDFETMEAIARDKFQYSYDFQQVRFDDYIESIQKGEYRYSNGLDQMLTRYKNISAGMGLDLIASPHGCRTLTMFINSGGKGLVWHNANHVNMVSIFRGSKVWNVLDPKYSVFVAPEKQVDVFATGFVAKKPQETWDKLPVRKIVLNAGDAYVNPVWYWHRITENIADEATKLVIMNSCRWSDVTSSFQASPALELHRHLGQALWVHPTMPTALQWIPYARVLQDSIREQMGWMPRFGRPGYEEDCFSSKFAACQRRFHELGLDVRSNTYK